MSKEKNVEEMSFEEALSELKQISERADLGDIKLEDSITAFERGAKLKNRCDNLLKEASLKIDKITKDISGNPISEDITDDF